jgi:hypothetical protein
VVCIDFGRETRLLGVAVIFVIIAVFLFAVVVLLFVLFVAGLLSKEHIGIRPRTALAGMLVLALCLSNCS